MWAFPEISGRDKLERAQFKQPPFWRSCLLRLRRHTKGPHVYCDPRPGGLSGRICGRCGRLYGVGIVRRVIR